MCRLHPSSSERQEIPAAASRWRKGWAKSSTKLGWDREGSGGTLSPEPCVPTAVGQCPANQVYQECGSACVKTCSNPQHSCSSSCTFGCFCPEGEGSGRHSLSPGPLERAQGQGDVRIHPPRPGSPQHSAV